MARSLIVAVAGLMYEHRVLAAFFCRSARRILPALALVAGLGLPVTVAIEERHESADIMTSSIFSDLNASEAPCRSHPDVPFSTTWTECGLVEALNKKSVAEFKERIDSLLNGYTVPEGEWGLDKRKHARVFFIDAMPITVVIDPKRHRVETSYPKPFSQCPTQTALGRFGWKEVTDPVPIRDRKVVPKYPRLARNAGLHGLVALQVVVRADGTVATPCVIHVDPVGAGFEDSALRAATQWRYRPATQDGEPVEVDIVFVVRFSP